MQQPPLSNSVAKARWASDSMTRPPYSGVVQTPRRKSFRPPGDGHTVLSVIDGGNSWSRYLRHMLDSTGLTITDLARQAQIDRSTVRGWVNRGSSQRIPIDSVVRVAQVLGVDPADALSAAAGISRDLRDPEVDMILSSTWSETRKADLIEQIMTRR